MKYSDVCKDRAQHCFLNIYNIETGKNTVIAEFSKVIEAPNWSNDGKFLYFNSYGKIYKYEIETGRQTQVDTGYADTCNNDHVLSPDNTAIAVSSGYNDSFTSQIHIVPFDGSGVQLVTEKEPSYLHGWSPDGRTLAYCAERGGEWDVYTIDINGGEETRLTDAQGLNDGPEYSADGKYIWFNSVRTGRMQIWRMKADGSDQTQMTFDEEMNSWFGHISPDMKKVVYIAYYAKDIEAGLHLPDLNVEIRMIPAEGGEEKTLLKFFGGQGSMNVNSWAPDSNRFAYVSYSVN